MFGEDYSHDIAFPNSLQNFRSGTLASGRGNGRTGKGESNGGAAIQSAVLAALESLFGQPLCKNRRQFIERVKGLFKDRSLSVKPPVLKAILGALGERDETADVCTDGDGRTEHDPDLRDYENVPLKEDVQEYFEREVKPHVPDAWIDESKTKKGYEIPFTRHFYKYPSLRPLAEIEADIRRLEKEIQGMLEAALA